MTEKIEVILVDIGNTNIKSAEVADGVIGDTNTWSSMEELHTFYPAEVPFMICHTGKFSYSNKSSRQVKILEFGTPVPISLDYHTPETLGPDRIAAAVGAYELFPNVNSLIIDLGTCMTIDFISAEGVFGGGIISPGLKMRMKAMSSFTSNLPDISDEWMNIENNVIGKSTKECLLSGSYQGLLHEINGVIREFEKNFTTINVILSGGDAHFFESNLKARIFAGSKIVQTGLYRIWKY